MLPSLVVQPPGGDTWLHEIKYDGYRTQLLIEGGQAQAFTRGGHDWSDRYRPIVQTARDLRCTSAIIDGEMCVQDQRGLTDYEGLLRAIAATPERLILFAFDLLHLDGVDLRVKPLLDRRRLLQDLIGPLGEVSRIQFSPDHIGDGRRLFAAADAAGLEGIVSKRIDSRYASGARTQSWRKAKCFTFGDFEVLGIERSRTGIPIALLRRPGTQAYAGDAMIVLPDHERQSSGPRSGGSGRRMRGWGASPSAGGRPGSGKDWSPGSGICAAPTSSGTQRCMGWSCGIKSIRRFFPCRRSNLLVEAPAAIGWG